jgi:formate dehydrogenase iron-sulfur subunit
MFGELDDVVKEGKERVQILKDNGFSNAYLYGEREQGGLRVMSVLKDYPEVYGLPRV